MDDVIDVDGDGVADVETVRADLDGDGVVDFVATAIDANGDGIADLVEVQVDADGDGAADDAYIVVDANGDGNGDIFARADGAEAIWGDVESAISPPPFSDPFNPLDATHTDFSFDGSQEFYEVHGTPQEDMQLWEVQDSPMSCAVATTNMVFRSVGIDNVSEDALANLFRSEGIYDPATGTNPEYIDDVINEAASRAGVDVHAVEIHGFDVDTLQQMLDNGIRPLVGVDSNELYHDPGATYAEMMGIPDAGHAVQVTGIIHSPQGDFVVINDPGFEGGAAQQIPLDRFMDAAADCGFEGVAVMDGSPVGIAQVASSVRWLIPALVKAGVVTAVAAAAWRSK